MLPTNLCFVFISTNQSMIKRKHQCLTGVNMSRVGGTVQGEVRILIAMIINLVQVIRHIITILTFPTSTSLNIIKLSS